MERETKWVDVDSIKPYPRNTKKHPIEQVKNVAKSIKKYGWQQPITVDKDGVIIIGHCRYDAALSLNLQKVPVWVAENLTEKQIRELRILDNKLNESDWDYSMLKAELPDLDLSEFDVDFGLEEDDATEDDLEEVDVPEVEEESEAEMWGVYELGDHILICGDSTDAKLRELIDRKADLVVTDPPYNVNISNSDGKTIKNDNMKNDEFQHFLNSAFINMEYVMRDGASFYVWYASKTHIPFESALNYSGLEVKEQLIWNKNRLILGRSDYQWKHEPCLYGWKDGKHYFCPSRNLTTVIDDKSIEEMSYDELLDLVRAIYDQSTVIDEKVPQKDDLHPTMKPVKLIGKLILNSSKKGDTVFDPFGGSGTTLICCEELGRKCITVEYDPHYADVIIRRWEDYTGKKAKRIK